MKLYCIAKKIHYGFFILSAFVLLFFGCSNDEMQVRKSALKYFQEGNNSFQHRDYQSAIWNYQKAINLDSETPNFYYNLGLTYFEIGNYEEAIESFKMVEQMAPEVSDTYYNISLAYYRLSKSRLADLYYNRYQDMLSLRKARERLEKKKEKQLREQQKAEEKKAGTPKPTSKKTGSASSKPKPPKGNSQVPSWE